MKLNINKLKKILSVIQYRIGSINLRKILNKIYDFLSKCVLGLKKKKEHKVSSPYIEGFNEKKYPNKGKTKFK